MVCYTFINYFLMIICLLPKQTISVAEPVRSSGENQQPSFRGQGKSSYNSQFSIVNEN